MANVVKEYLYSLKPFVDNALWNKATEGIKSKLENSSKKRNAYLEKEKQIQKEISELLEKRSITEDKKKFLESKGISTTKINNTLAELDLEEQKLNLDKEFVSKMLTNSDTMGKIVGNMSNVASSAGMLINIFEKSLEKAQEILDKSTEVSNKFVSGSSAFVDTDVKNKMLSFGVDSMTAQSMLAAEGALGIDASDYATLTEGQRKAFDELMSYYQEGLSELNSEELEEYNKAMQEYQLSMAKFDMEIELAFMKLFSNSDTLLELGDTVSEFFNSIVGLLSSDAAQFAFDTFVSFLNSIISIIGLPLKLLGGAFGGNTTNNNHNETNIYNNTGTYGSNPLYLQQSNNVQF